MSYKELSEDLRMPKEYKSRFERRNAENSRDAAHNDALAAANASNAKPKRKRKVWHWVLIVISILALIVAGIGGVLYAKSKNAADSSYKASGMKKARDVDQVLKEGKPFSILLMGTDTGELGRDYKGRTDSMMVVTINPKEHQTTIMSIPRDTLVSIPGYENQFPQKINAAYELGSSATSIHTVQDWLNVPIDYYALVNMGGLEKVVNQLDGITVKSPLTFEFNPDTAHADPGNLYSFKEGSSTFTHTGEDGKTETFDKMDGKAALAFSRMRYADPKGDYGRQERQRMVMEGILDKIKKDPTRVLSSGFIEEVGKSTQTDLTFGNVMTIGRKYLPAASKIKSDHVQGDGYILNSGSTEVVYRDEQQRATDVLRKSLGLDAKTTGNLYGGEISDDVLAANGVPTLVESSEKQTNSDMIEQSDQGDDEAVTDDLYGGE